MDVKGTLKGITLELRRELEGKHDAQGTWQAGDLERRLAAIGVRRDRAPVPVYELPHLPPEDREARRVVDAFLQSRAQAGQAPEGAIADFVRDAAYTWANRLLALRCMEARGLIDEVILQKDAYGGRSLQHQRLARKEPERCSGEDEGLLAVLFDEFARRARELPLLFDPKASEMALRPSLAALKRCIALLSGTLAAKGQEAATDEVFTAPDALGWTYQYWNAEEKDRVFEKVRTEKGAKIEGAEIVPATCIYTEPYMVKFLVQNSLGATWIGINPGSRLCDGWEYYVRDADRAPVSKKAVSEITFLDPACGSGHFLIEAFDLFYAMYLEEGALTDRSEICAAILDRNLYGIDIDERAIQIAALALVMKAKEKAPDLVPRQVNLVATNIRLPAGKEHLEAFLRKHPEDAPLKPALLAIFEGLAHADELGSLLQIEEPVDRELRHIRDQQLMRERKAAAGTLFDPRKDEDWAAWKHDAIERVSRHFGAEAQEADLATAFFGEAASKGLSLVDLLARRYDVVAANPPYMGSKNMGGVLKRYVERQFSPGRRDLYAAFILRCLELSGSGRVGMVMPQSWMFIRSFAELRAADDGKRGVLRTTRIETLAQLGRHAFSEADPPSNVVLAAFACSEPTEAHWLSCFRLSAPMPAEEQAFRLRNAIEDPVSSIRFRPVQRRFLTIPQAPVCYWLRDRFLELLAGRRLGDVATLAEPTTTGNNERFIRAFWESPSSDRWWRASRGGGYRKWDGYKRWMLDWGDTGSRIKSAHGSFVRNEKAMFMEGLTYTESGRGALGARRLDPGETFSKSGPGVFPGSVGLSPLAAILNCRISSYLLRVTARGFMFGLGSLAQVPIPTDIPPRLACLEAACVFLKRHLLAYDPTEWRFKCGTLSGRSLGEAHGHVTEDAEAVAALLHSLEGICEREVVAAFHIEPPDLQPVLDEAGTPPGWFPLIVGYDATPNVQEGIGVPEGILGTDVLEPGRVLSRAELGDLKRRLLAIYEAGPGAKTEDAAPAPENDDEEDNEGATSGARIPIPFETFVEELAQQLEVHPISVYWLLREVREEDGVFCKPELVRFVEDHVSILVLRLLGHRWPREVEAAEPAPAFAEPDGIIALTGGTAEQTLVSRVRNRFADEFGLDRVVAIEREFEEITGRSLGGWLFFDFFKRHVSQFKKRPIAWQIESAPRGNEKRQFRRGARMAPAFSCLVYYGRLDSDLLPKLRTQYVGPVRASFQTELAGLEKLKNRSADQDARRLELEEKLDELKAFDARLEQGTIEGFGSSALDKVAAKEPLDKWTSRDGRAHALGTRDAFLAQERRYDPDLNDGVRVNIAPLQRARLLAADVLAAKDVEKAIADRAEWRADERRWCREGKLLQPGWWGTAVDRR